MAENTDGSQSGPLEHTEQPRPKAKPIGVLLCFSSDSLGYLIGPHVTKTKPPSDIWRKFQKVDNGKVICSKCDWQTYPNATRMIAHWNEKHKHPEEDALIEGDPPEKKSKIMDHFDRNLTPKQHEKAAKQLVFAMINTGPSC